MARPRKLSMWTSFLWDLSPEQALSDLQEAGWAYAELSEEHSHVLVARGQDVAATGKAFRTAADDCGVSVLQGHLDLQARLAEDDRIRWRTMLDSVRRRLEMFLAIGIEAAVIHPGRGRIADSPRHAEDARAALGELVAMVEGSATVICLENVPSGRAMDRLLVGMDSPHVGVCYDTGHLNLTEEDPVALITGWGRRLRALHLSDNDGTADQHLFPPSTGGTIDWSAVIGAMDDVGYDGLWNFELPGENRCDLDERKRKLATFRQRASEML